MSTVSDVQLWIKTEDAISSESPIGPAAIWEDGTGKPRKYTDALEYFDTFVFKDKKRFKYQLKVNYKGVIMNGNYRYHWARWLGIPYLPVDLDYMMGLNNVAREQLVIRRPTYSLTKPMKQWRHDGTVTYPNSLIQLGGNPKINLSLRETIKRLGK